MKTAVLHGRVMMDIAGMVALLKAVMANIAQNITIALGLKAVFLVTTVVGVTASARHSSRHRCDGARHGCYASVELEGGRSSGRRLIPTCTIGAYRGTNIALGTPLYDSLLHSTPFAGPLNYRSLFQALVTANIFAALILEYRHKDRQIFSLLKLLIYFRPPKNSPIAVFR